MLISLLLICFQIFIYFIDYFFFANFSSIFLINLFYFYTRNFNSVNQKLLCRKVISIHICLQLIDFVFIILLIAKSMSRKSLIKRSTLFVDCLSWYKNVWKILIEFKIIDINFTIIVLMDLNSKNFHNSCSFTIFLVQVWNKM